MKKKVTSYNIIVFMFVLSTSLTLRGWSAGTKDAEYSIAAWSCRTSGNCYTKWPWNSCRDGFKSYGPFHCWQNDGDDDV